MIIITSHSLGTPLNTKSLLHKEVSVGKDSELDNHVQKRRRWEISELFQNTKKPFDYFYCKKLSVEGETAVSQISAVKIFGLWANLEGGGGYWTLEATNNLWTILIVTFPIIVNLAHRSLLSQKRCGRTTCLPLDIKLYQNYHYYRDDDDREDDDDYNDEVMMMMTMVKERVIARRRSWQRTSCRSQRLHSSSSLPPIWTGHELIIVSIVIAISISCICIISKR